MKAVIIEIHKNIAVLLSEDGCINKIRNKNYTVGQEVEMNIKEKSNIGRAAVFAAAACFALILGFGGATYYTEAAYVSLDVNPSIEYGVNMYDRVISVKGVNDDGTEIIDRISLRELKNRKIKDAIALTVSEIASEGYLSADEAGIVIATSSGNTKKAEKMAQRLEKAATEVYDKNSGAPSVNAQAVGRDRVKQAKELGVTPGKLNLVERLKASAQEPESIDINEWLNKPVKDIIAQIKQNKELEKNKVKENQNAERKTKETTAPEEGATDAPEKNKSSSPAETDNIVSEKRGKSASEKNRENTSKENSANKENNGNTRQNNEPAISKGTDSESTGKEKADERGDKAPANNGAEENVNRKK